MRWIASSLKASPAACLLLAAACDAPGPATVPLSEATAEAEQLFPAYLATTGRGCGYPATSNPPVLDEFSSEWYSWHLSAANERPFVELAASAPQQVHVRFLWLRSFHEPIIVRVHGRADGTAKIEAKRLSGAGGYEPGEIADRLSRDLSPAEYREFETLLGASNLADEPAANCDLGMDGAQWILEVVADGQYYYVDRWAPKSGPVRDVAFKMLSLTGWDLEPVY